MALSTTTDFVNGLLWRDPEMPPTEPSDPTSVPALVEPAAAPPVSAEVLAREFKVAVEFAVAALSPAARKAYWNDFSAFERWCAQRGLVALPADPEAVAAFLAAEASAGLKPSTIARRAAAIRYAHGLRRKEPPTNTETVRATVRGIRRSKGVAPDQKAPATAARIVAMVAFAPADTPRGRRDHALLLLGSAAPSAGRSWWRCAWRTWSRRRPGCA